MLLMPKSEMKRVDRELASIIASRMQEFDFKTKLASIRISARQKTEQSVLTFSMSRKDYGRLIRYDIDFSVNWNSVFDLYALDDPIWSPSELDRFALANVHMDSFASERLAARAVSDASEIADYAVEQYHDIAVPFFREFENFKEVRMEYINITNKARRYTRFPITLSRVAICGMILNPVPDPSEVIGRHLRFLRDYPPNMTTEFIDFVARLRRRGHPLPEVESITQ